MGGEIAIAVSATAKVPGREAGGAGNVSGEPTPLIRFGLDEALSGKRTVVSRPLVIAQDRVGGLDRRGAVGRFAAGIGVGMIAALQRAIGGADHDILGCRCHSQD
jgi:hypothetical protein